MDMEQFYGWNTASESNVHRAYSANSVQQESFSNRLINNSVFSEVENAILSSMRPIDLAESEEITVNGQKGIWANKTETINWTGVMPISEYPINDDQDPEIIRKKTEQDLIYQQEIAIRYLRPPTPPPPGEIIIKEEESFVESPAPPLVIRQQPFRSKTPPPLIIREAPPHAPVAIPQRIITIASHKKLPPPPRKVVVERLPPIPSKPQPIIIERWLPYKPQRRQVIYVKSGSKEMPKNKNLIVQWETPNIREKKDLDVAVKASQSEYFNRYAMTLKNNSMELPSFVKEIDLNSLQEQKISKKNKKNSLKKIISINNSSQSSISSSYNQNININELVNLKKNEAASFFSKNSADFNLVFSLSRVNEAVNEILSTAEVDSKHSITVKEAEKLMLRLHSKLGRKYGELEANSFFNKLNITSSGKINFDEFRKVLFQKLNI